ncbi:putative signal peptide protein [Puccinia sorghi]|uniref:Putative signal peptide protein n=1 Tax=Puccinia sorghi TaxID=27349 RepID=A0A0L6UFS7_9BASI|nr:putative signal peptide protein [Puccinia sorghi]
MAFTRNLASILMICISYQAVVVYPRVSNLRQPYGPCQNP